MATPELDALAMPPASGMGAAVEESAAPEELEPSENPVLIEMVDDFKAASGGDAVAILSDILHEMGFRRAQ